MADVDRREPDENRDRRDNLEIHDRLDSHAAHFFNVCVACDAHHKSAEKQRCDNNFDQPKKNRAKHLEFHRQGGGVVAELGSSR